MLQISDPQQSDQNVDAPQPHREQNEDHVMNPQDDDVIEESVSNRQKSDSKGSNGVPADEQSDDVPPMNDADIFEMLRVSESPKKDNEQSTIEEATTGSDPDTDDSEDEDDDSEDEDDDEESE